MRPRRISSLKQKINYSESLLKTLSALKAKNNPELEPLIREGVDIERRLVSPNREVSAQAITDYANWTLRVLDCSKVK